MSDFARSRLIKRLFLKDRWFLGIRRRSAGAPGYADTHGYRVLRPPRDRFYADPFLLKRDGVNHLFFEDYRYEKSRGVIGCMTLDPDGQPVAERTVLERPYHLSFPFVFTWAGETWMVPETSSNGTIELYRARRFPECWRLEAVLMKPLRASDSVLLFHRERWWLFTSIESHGRPRYGDLFLFHADSPLGPWHAHPMNPVIADASRARPAGSIFEVHGALLRPGQDCAQGYGRAITFNRIAVLDEARYLEHPIRKTLPTWTADCEGTHTYNFNEDFEVLDGYTVRMDLYGKWLSLRGVAKQSLPHQAARISPLFMEETKQWRPDC